MFNKKTFAIWRPTVTTGALRPYQDTGLKITGMLDPMDAEFAAITGSAFGKSFKLYVQNIATDVREVDRLILGDDQYEVKGVQVYDNKPRHIEVMIEKVIKQ